MRERISKGLAHLFDSHRIVFWYDADRDLRNAFEGVELEGVEKVELANNEFGVKHRILREAPERCFLLYRHGPEPALIDNWLLDVQLAHAVFKTDQAAIWLAELGLGLAFEDVIRAHAEFFRSARRLEQLKRLLRADDTAGGLRLRMLAVCAGVDGDFDAVVEALLDELAEGKDDRLRLIGRAGLEPFLWDRMARQFDYRPAEPTIADFAITLFKSCYMVGVGEGASLGLEAMVFFRRWKNTRHFASAFERLSTEYSDVLGIPDDLARRDFRSLIPLDFFEEIDREIIRNLVREVSARTAAHAEILAWIRQRRQGYWYDRFRDLYEAIGHAAAFQHAMIQATLGMTSLADGVQRYAKTWFRIDQLYRKFIHHMQRSAQASLMAELNEQVENLYTNAFLLKLNDAWQAHVDAAERWDATPVRSQAGFFEAHVAPFRRKDQKICVIVSDAMRYEIGEELLGRVRSLDRYDAEIAPMLASLPSYTQLGMAALLPHRELAIAENDTGTVFVDGMSSQGLANRRKILETARPNDRVTAHRADDVLAMRGDDARALFRDHDIVYIYHNRIDATGDKPVSEERVFEAAEDALDELVTLVKKLTAANASNLLITADHGFIYQNRPIEESDFSRAEVAADTILFRDRRFVLGHGLKANAGLRAFTATELRLNGAIEVQIPKSINRLRRQGSGSRYVHGGASLQEVVVPVLRINKKRQSDISAVEVEIVSSSNRTITASQISVMFYQSIPVTEKSQPRILRAGLYALSGEPISDSQELTFDFRSENPRERETPVRFLLSKRADEFNGQEVVLKLEERHAGTAHYKEYRSTRYMLRRSFSNDFDF